MMKLRNAVTGMAMAIAATGCSSSSSPPADEPTGDGGTGSGLTSGGCTYQQEGSECELWSNATSGQVQAAQHNCVMVFGGTAVSSCPTAAVIGVCTVPAADPAEGETDQIFFYPPSGTPVLTPEDDCTNANGTYAASP